MIELSEERKKHYSQKLQWITQRINLLPSLEENDENYGIILDAFLYRVQTSTDAAMDIIAMLCKDFGEVVGDDYTNIKNLASRRVITKELSSQLFKLNGIRNALVHQYHDLNGKSILEARNEIVAIVEQFIEVVENLVQ